MKMFLAFLTTTDSGYLQALVPAAYFPRTTAILCPSTFVSLLFFSCGTSRHKQNIKTEDSHNLGLLWDEAQQSDPSSRAQARRRA